MTFNIIDVFRESFTMVILLICSIILLTFIIERWWCFRKMRVDIHRFMSNIQQFIKAGKFPEAINLCDNTSGAVPVVIKTGLVHRYLHKPDLEELMVSARLEQLVKLEKFLGVLGTLGNIAPLIGLFGTVIGIIRAFRDLAMSGSGGPAVVAAGIAEALVTTASGLIVAVPAVMFYNYFTKKMKAIAMDMDICSRRLLVMLRSDIHPEG